MRLVTLLLVVSLSSTLAWASYSPDPSPTPKFSSHPFLKGNFEPSFSPAEYHHPSFATNGKGEPGRFFKASNQKPFEDNTSKRLTIPQTTKNLRSLSWITNRGTIQKPSSKPAGFATISEKKMASPIQSPSTSFRTLYTAKNTRRN